LRRFARLKTTRDLSENTQLLPGGFDNRVESQTGASHEGALAFERYSETVLGGRLPLDQAGHPDF
jgi:hypothetical protein